MTMNKYINKLGSYRMSQFLGRLIRSPGSLRRRKGSGALREEIGVWNSRGEGQFFFPMFLRLSHIKVCFWFFVCLFFSLSPELMIMQQNSSVKLCSQDYITTILLEDSFSFLRTF